MTVLRVLAALAAVAMVLSDLLLQRPGSFTVAGTGALLLFVIGAGAVAADALPLRRVPLVCSLAATLLAPLALLRQVSPWVVGFAAVVLYVVGELAARGLIGPPDPGVVRLSRPTE